MIHQARKLLGSVFGYKDFISLQSRVVEDVLRGRDVLAVMPTGGGKSLCYQVPALLFPGVTLVVSPLVALMQDQMRQLAQWDVPAACLNSALPLDVYRRHAEAVRRGEAKLLYLAPETLLKPAVLDLLDAASVSCLAIDEAHCISRWGHDFRPEYRRLAEVRARYPRAPCLALTATATPRVRRDIAECLGIPRENEHVAGFDRENLFLQVEPKTDPLNQLSRFLERFPEEAGIVYCATRKQTEVLCEALGSRGHSALPYHAGLSDEQRRRRQEGFLRDDTRIVVATVAFGMGIDKSNVRFVVHYDLPKDLESYYQEIGRAGRDGLKSHCLLLFSRGDIPKIKHFIDGKEEEERKAAYAHLNAMVDFAQWRGCRRKPLLGYFGESLPREACGMCDNCLAGPVEEEDATVAAQKLLSCVARTRERFGALHVIDVLRGSRSQKVLKAGHDRLSTHGIGREHSREQWRDLVRQFLHKGLLTQDLQFGSLGLTPEAWEVLRGKKRVHAVLEKEEEPSPPPSTAGGEESAQPRPRLFEALRRKRKELADAADVPPYVVFSDKTLAQIAARLPRSREALLEIHGVGEAKLERYGEVFLEAVREFLSEHGLDAPDGPPSPPPRPRAVVSGSRHREVGQAFNEGRSVKALAEAYDVRIQTILKHLYNYAREGGALRENGFLPLLTLPEERVEKALEAFRSLGHEMLRPVLDALGGEASYDDLHVLRLHYLSLRGPGKETGPGGKSSPREKAIVCLANSRKHSGRCVAGKEWTDGIPGRWIRPVSDRETGELSPDRVRMDNGRTAALLDVIAVPLEKGCGEGYQRENHLAGALPWRWKARLPASEASRLLDPVDRLWIDGHHSFTGINDRIPLDLVRESVSSSLLFVRPQALDILVAPDAKGLKRVRAELTLDGELYRIPVTDPLAEERFLRRAPGRYPLEGDEIYVTVSLGEPFEGYCYKLAAGIVVVSPASDLQPIENVLQGPS